jgi:NADH dehydrogenase FAD-containing subunit
MLSMNKNLRGLVASSGRRHLRVSTPFNTNFTRFSPSTTTSTSTTTRTFSTNASAQEKQSSSSTFKPNTSNSNDNTFKNGKYTFALVVVSATMVLIYQLNSDDDDQEQVYAQELPPTTNPAPAISHDVLSLDKNDPNRKPRLVILGTGWGAISVLHYIDHTKYEVIIVSPRNYFLFTPMLPSTTTGSVDYRSILDPIRNAIYRKTKNRNIERDSIQFYEARCDAVDYKTNTILCEKLDAPGTLKIEYDKLVISVGATINTFGTKGVEQYCHFLKEVDHARSIRKSLVTALEKASYPGLSDEEKKRILHFAIVGGGPSGVELAAELNDFLVEEMNKLYPTLLPHMKISVLEMTPHILSVFDKTLYEYTEKKFRRDRINLLVQNRVMEVKDKELVVFDVQNKQQNIIPYGVCVWATGIKQNPLVEKIAATLPDSQKHKFALSTDGCLRVQGIPAKNIYAIGDCSRIEQKKLLDTMVDLFTEGDADKDGKLSLIELEELIKKNKKAYPQFQLYVDKVAHYYEKFDVNKDGMLDVNEFKSLLEMADSQLKPLPATAQVASQQGEYLGKSLNGASHINTEVDPFVYKHLGHFAFIGSRTAVADIFNYRSGGFISYVAYKSAYFERQVSWKNRFALIHDWIKTTTFGRDLSKF